MVVCQLGTYVQRPSIVATFVIWLAVGLSARVLRTPALGNSEYAALSQVRRIARHLPGLHAAACLATTPAVAAWPARPPHAAVIGLDAQAQ